MPFDESQYDLNTPEGKAAYIRDWKIDLKERGYQVDEEHEREPSSIPGGKGYYTLNGLATLTDQYAHNVGITLNDTVTLLGGRNTEAGAVVGNLYHDLVAMMLAIHRTVLHHAERDGATALHGTTICTCGHPRSEHNMADAAGYDDGLIEGACFNQDIGPNEFDECVAFEREDTTARRGLRA